MEQSDISDTQINEDEIEMLKHGNIHKHIPMVECRSSIYKIAKDLIDDDNLSICRDIGIMKKRDKSPDHHSRRDRDRDHDHDHGCCHDRDDYSTRSGESARNRSHSDERYRSNRNRSSYSPQRRNNARRRTQCYNREEPWSRDMKRAFSPSRDRERTGELDRSWFSDDTSDSENEMEFHKFKKGGSRRCKSGINAKPCSKVKQ